MLSYSYKFEVDLFVFEYLTLFTPSLNCKERVRESINGKEKGRSEKEIKDRVQRDKVRGDELGDWKWVRTK